MPRFPTTVVLGGLVLFSAACADTVGPPPIEVPEPSFSQAAAEAPQSLFAEHFIVAYAGGEIPAAVAAAISAAGGEISNSMDGIPFAAVSGITDDLARELQTMQGVSGVSRDVHVQWIPEAGEAEAVEADAAAPSSHDPTAAFFYSRQWNMRQIDADDAWAAGADASGAVVAILDTGVDPFHQDLDGLVDWGRSVSTLSSPSICDLFRPDQNTFFDFNFHGTHVAGTVSSNGLGTAAVAPNATIVGVKVLNCLGSGSFADINAGILYAASIGVDVINMSLGGTILEEYEEEAEDFEFEFNNDVLIDAMQAAIDAATDAGVVVVVSAGNGATNLDELEFEFESGGVEVEYSLLVMPAMLDGVLAISATAPFNQANFDRTASYTNHGEDYIFVAAPGGDGTPQIRDQIIAPCSSLSLFFFCPGGNWYLYLFGTSMASPHVAGTAALLAAQGADAEDAADGIADSADDLGNELFMGAGRLNVFRAWSGGGETDD